MQARPIDDMIERVSEYAKTFIRSQAKEIDQSSAFPEESFRHLADMGVMRIPFERTYGGLGGVLQDILTVIQEVSRECASTASVLLTQISFGITPIHQYGTKEQKLQYLPALLSGESLGAFALNEIESGSNLDKIQTVAVERDGYWELTGAKHYISNGGFASVYSVVAKTIAKDGSEDYGIFLLESDMDGFQVGEQVEKMGIRGMPVASISFENVHVPAEAMLGGAPCGKPVVYAIKNYNKLYVAAQAIGIAEGVFERTLTYMQQDRRFGQRLIDLPNNQHKLAESYTEIMAASTLLKQVQTFDSNEKCWPAMVKVKASNVAVYTAETAMHLTGGYGYMRDNDIERFVRDAKLTQIYGGSSNTQLEILSRPWVERQKNS